MNASEENVVIDLRARERRLYDRIRARLARTEPGQPSGAVDLMLLLPDFVVLLSRLARDQRVPAGGKVIALLAMGYVLSPIDLLPEFLGPIGFFDDLVVVAAALSRMVNYVHPDVVRSHWSGQGDVLLAIQRIAEWSESIVTDQVPATVRRVLRAIGISRPPNDG